MRNYYFQSIWWECPNFEIYECMLNDKGKYWKFDKATNSLGSSKLERMEFRLAYKNSWGPWEDNRKLAKRESNIVKNSLTSARIFRLVLELNSLDRTRRLVLLGIIVNWIANPQLSAPRIAGKIGRVSTEMPLRVWFSGKLFLIIKTLNYVL